MNGYIKLFRQFKEWEWYQDQNIKSLFLHCLLSANFKTKKWQGEVIKRGQFVTSLFNLSDETGLSIKQVRTALEKLRKTGEITTKGKSFTVITLCKFDSYQKINQEEGTERAHDGHKEGTERATTEERKEGEERKEEYSYLAEFEKIKNGEQTRVTELDKRFHFGLLKEEWSDNFKNEILGMWRYLEGRCDKPQYWGNIGTITTQINVIKSSLNQFTEQDIIKAFEGCKFNSRVTWNKYLRKKENKGSQRTDEYIMTLEEYYSQIRKFDSSKIRRLKNNYLPAWNKKLEESMNYLEERANEFKNESVTTLFIFDLCYGFLGSYFNTNDEKQRFDSFKRWYDELSDYNRNKGNILELLNRAYSN